MVTSARWLSKTSQIAFPPPNNNDSAMTHEQKCLCWSCGIQHHMPRDLGAVSPTCVLGDRHRLLFQLRILQCPMKQHQPFSATTQEPLENTVLDNHSWMKEILWEAPSRGVPARHWSKKIWVWMHWKVWMHMKNSVTLSTSPFPQDSTAQCQKRPSSAPNFSRWRKWQHVSDFLSSAAV